MAEYNSNTINSTDGVQIDLLIIRDDNVINLCEIKFSGDVYQIDKDEELKLRRRIATLKEHISPKQTIHLTMITTYGITNGKHSDIVQKTDLYGRPICSIERIMKLPESSSPPTKKMMPNPQNKFFPITADNTL